MSTGAEIRIPSSKNSYYVSGAGYPKTMRSMLEDFVKKSKDDDGDFVKNLNYYMEQERDGYYSGRIDSIHTSEIVDYIYKIDEEGEIYYKESGGEAWLTYD